MMHSGEADAGDATEAAGRSPHELVTALWREVPPPLARAADGRTASVALQRALARLSALAELLDVDAPTAPPSEAALLGQTARSLCTFLALGERGAARDALIRVARLERWLSLRARQEPAARSAADLALWALEHFEAVVRD